MEELKNDTKKRRMLLLTLFVWLLVLFLATNYLSLSQQVDELRDSVESARAKVKLMERWAEEIKRAKRGGKISVLGEVEKIASKWGVSLESARPEGDGKFEIRIRRINPRSLAGFLADIHERFEGRISKLRISKSFGAENLNDLEVTILVR